ncbi:MAG: ABC transporter substrate-binding protein [Deltaproteobacteria bacterium]|nr:ABC transporter substrate-binding protein [Deltaproteobacteria bacterium]
MKCHRLLPMMPSIVLGLLLYWAPLCFAQERPTISAGHGTLSGSILPLWVGAEARLFEKHGLQVKPIYLPRAVGRPALLSGDIQVYFSAGPPLVQMRLGGADVVVTSCVVHKLTSKIMVTPAIQKVADLRGRVLAVANPGSASDFAAKLFLARQGMKPGQDVSIIYSGSTSAAFAALVNGRVQAIFATAPNDLQAAQAGFKPLLELGDLSIPYAGNCSAAMRPYIAKQPARMRSFVAGITEAVAYIRLRPTESQAILQKYTRVSDPTILQHTYDSDTRYMEPVPRPTPEGTKTILENLGVSGRAAEQFVAEFIDDRFMKQIVDEGLLKQIYPSGVPAR